MNFFILTLIKAGLVASVLMTTLAYLQWIERKVIAHVQIASALTASVLMGFFSPWPMSSS